MKTLTFNNGTVSVGDVFVSSWDMSKRTLISIRLFLFMAKNRNCSGDSRFGSSDPFNERI
ncbi:Uncharacterised protein [Escherichia coli]|nr:Uncharacterised protein [Escherichia coli]